MTKRTQMSTINPPNPANGVLAGAVGTWSLDPSLTTIELRTKAMWGLAKVKGNFKAVGGEGTVTDGSLVNGTLVIDASSASTGNNKRDAHLRSADFFESEKYPTFVFTALSASPAGTDNIKVSGTLTVHGQARPLDIVVTVAQTGPGTATLRSEFEVDRSKWGLTWAKMGAKLVSQVSVSAHYTKN
jgi:polyisoprenoid-binding protein YceI